MANFFFFVTLSFLLAHEMDAVRRSEWHVFPGLSRLKNDEYGYMIFTIIHVPLYLLLLLGLFSDGGRLNYSVVIGFDIFCMVHVLLHVIFMKHPRYKFNNWLSWSLILGAGVAGAADLFAFRFFAM
ncbi:MAG: hypothetical protein H0T53_12280 [Herpetosiphonaceae bacterium]|nr:hypothetical protein [Herpetosiphonaceae bacterium]